MGFRSAGAPTRIGLENVGTPESGDILIRPGVAILGTHPMARLLQFDADPAQLPNPYGLFLPGALSARTIAILRNPQGSGRVRELEANLGVLAGAGTDATNFFGIRVAGAVSGSIEIPINAQARRRFRSDIGQLGPVASRVPTSRTAPGVGFAYAQRFKPSGNLTVTGASWEYRDQGGTWEDPFSGVPKKMRILSADRQTVLADSGTHLEALPKANTGAAGDSAVFSFLFQSAVALVGGTEYWLTIEILDGVGRIQPYCGSVAAQGLTNLSAPTSPHLIQVATAGTSVQAAIDGVNINDASAGNQGSGTMYLIGSNQGAVLAGDLTIDILLHGVAPTVPGSDVNLTMTFA